MRRKQRKVLLSVCSALTALTMVGATGVVLQTAQAAETTSTFEMIYGASIRVSDPTGIRFKAKLGEDYYDQLSNGTDNAELHVALIPYAMYTEYQADETKGEMALYPWLTSKYTKAGIVDVTVPVEKIYSVTNGEETYYCANGVLSNVYFNNYHLEFVGVAYIQRGTAGNYTYEDVTNINEADNARSIFEVACKASENAEDYAKYKTFLDTAIEKGMYRAYGVTCQETIDVEGNKTTESYKCSGTTYSTYEAMKEGVGITVSESTVTIEGGETIAIDSGTSTQLNATLAFSDGTQFTQNAHYIWSSSDETIVSVDENGVVTPKGAGSATVTVSAIGGRFTDICTVSVTKGSSTVNLDYEFLAQGDAGTNTTDTGNATIDLTEMGIVGTNVTEVLCNGTAVTIADKTATSITLTNAPAGTQEYTFETTVADYVLDGCVYGQGISTKDEFLAWQTAAAAGTGKCYTVLLNDIDLEGATLADPTSYYYGTFDGMGHTVSDFTYTKGVVQLQSTGIVKNVQFTEAVQDCTAIGSSTIMVGFFGGNILGTVENVKICTTTQNITAGIAHRSVLAWLVNGWSAEGALGHIKNVVIEVTPQADITHYITQQVGNTAILENVHVYFKTAGVTDSTYPANKGGSITNTKLYATQAEMLAAVDFSTWADPWQIDFSGVPYIGEPVERETIEIAGEFLAKGDAGTTVTNTGNATFDLSATGYDFSGTAKVLCNGEAVTLASKTATSVTLTDAPAGKQVYTIVTPEADYVINGFVYGQGISTKDEFLAWQTAAAAGTGKCYTVLLNDIDLEGATLATPTTYYYGTFDGMAHTVSNFTYTKGLIWMMYPSVVKNVQFTEAVQDCTFAGTAVVQFGFFGQTVRGTVENVKVSVTTKNMTAEHRGVIFFGLNHGNTETAPSLMQNVVVEVTPQADVAHYAYQAQATTEGLATIKNVYMYFTTSGTGGFDRFSNGVYTNSGFYATQAEMLADVDFSTWAEPWLLDENGVPYIGEAQVSAPNDNKVTVNVETVLDAPANGVVGSDKTGTATVDFAATGYTLGEVSSVACGTLDITYSVNGNTLIFTDAPAGEKVYTVVSGNTTYIVTINVYIIEKEAITVDGTFYGSDNDTTTLAIESAAVDFSGSEVTLGNVQSVTYGDGTEATYSVSGNTLTLTNVLAGEETYTIVTDTHIYIVNICLYGYGISTKDEFITWQSTEAIKYSNKAYTVLLNDIDLEDATLADPTSYYYGTFDGRAHTVSNFTYGQGFVWLLNPAVVKNVQFTNATQDCSFAGTGAASIGFFGSYIRGTVENVKLETTTSNMASGAEHRAILAANVANGNSAYPTYLTNVVVAITPQSGSYHYVAMNANAYGTWDNVYAYYAVANTKGGALYANNNATITNSAFYDSASSMLADVDFSTWEEPWQIGTDGVPYIGEAIVRQTIEVEGEFLAQGDGGIAQNATTGNATIDFTDTVVSLGNVQSVTYGEENTAVTYSVSGNALTLTNAPAGDETYTIVTSGDTYIVNACIYGHSISTVEEFEAYRTHGANWAYTVLLNDIDFDGASLASTSAYLRGTFDGRGHTLANVTLQASLFGNVYANTGAIKNLQLINATQDCTNIVTTSVNAVRNGFLAQTVNGTIENVLIKGELINLPEGIAHWGLVCYNGTPVIKNVIVDVKSSGTAKQMAANIAAGTLDNVYMVLNNEDLVYQSAVTDYTGATNTGVYATESKLLEAVDFSSWGEPWIVDGSSLPYMSNYSEYLGFIHDAYVGTTSYKLVENGASEYKVLMNSDTYTEIWTTFTDFQTYFAEATGVTLSWAQDKYASNYSDTAKFISLGKTAALEQSGIEVDYDLLGTQGYQIITLGDDIYICGENEGLSNAIYDLLNRLVGLEVYTTTRYAIDTVTDVALPDLYITEIPDSEYRLAVNGELAQYETNTNATRRALRIHNMGDIIVDGGKAHNMTSTIVPYEEWSSKTNWFYNGGAQLCYTAHGNATDYEAMVAEAVANIKELLLADTEANLLSLTQMDVTTWCDCSACSALNTKYGTDAASQIIFVNDVTDIINEWLITEQGGREVQFAIFAYYTTKTAPATQNADGSWTAIDETVILNDNVSVWIAPIEDDFRININSDEASQNNMRTLVESWSACASSYWIWAYDAYFHNYMIPYDTYDAMQDMVRFCAEYNTKFFYAQGPHDLTQNTAFGDVKGYLYSKLMWNSSLDVNTLIDNFFKDVYKEAASSMKSVFEAWRTKSATFGGNIYSTSNSWLEIINNFDNDWLKTQLGLLETAISEISAYETSAPDLYTAIYDSIVAESISLRYLYKQRNSSEYSSSAWGTLAEDAARLGVNMVSEGTAF